MTSSSRRLCCTTSGNISVLCKSTFPSVLPYVIDRSALLFPPCVPSQMGLLVHWELDCAFIFFLGENRWTGWKNMGLSSLLLTQWTAVVVTELPSLQVVRCWQQIVHISQEEGQLKWLVKSDVLPWYLSIWHVPSVSTALLADLCRLRWPLCLFTPPDLLLYQASHLLTFYSLPPWLLNVSTQFSSSNLSCYIYRIILNLSENQAPTSKIVQPTHHSLRLNCSI